MADVTLKRRIWGWMSFDWATQPFYTLGLTFVFGPYFAAISFEYYQSQIADVDAAISTFDSAIANNAASIQNSDAARAVLLDTDYAEESTLFAESRVKVDAASAVLAQINARIQNLLQLLQQ